MSTRKYDPATDYYLIVAAVREADTAVGPTLVGVAKAFRGAGLEWPVLNHVGWRPKEEEDYATLVDRDILKAREAQKWQVTYNGEPTKTSGSYNDCWQAIHRASSGNSVEWMIRYEGWGIVPVTEEKSRDA